MGDIDDRAESVLDALYEFDLTGTLTYSNRACLDLFGYSLEETIGKLKVQELIAKEDIPVSRKDIDVIMRGGIAIGKRSFLRKDGSTFIGEVHSGAILSDGKPIGVRGIIRDITARELMEGKLRESEESFRQIVESMPYSVEILDKQGTVVMVNRVCREMFHMDAPELFIGKQNVFQDPVTKKLGLLDSVQKAFSGEVVRLPEVLIPASVDTPHLSPVREKDLYLDITLFPIMDLSGVVKRVAVIRKDITDNKRREEEMIRTQKLESLGLLSSGIAHDFNNLLSGIFGFIDLALASLTPECDAVSYLNDALRAFDKARGLTQQLLTFAKGGIPQKKSLDLWPLIRDTVDLTLTGSNVRAKLEFPEKPWSVSGDEGQIGQVMGNLLINARQAMPGGGVIRIGLGNVTLAENEVNSLPGGDFVSLEIEDSGVGIPSGQLTKIFDPFYTTKQNGSGMGLAICHSIVKKHAGHITVTSIPGKGTTFTVYLPAVQGTQKDVQEPDDCARAAGRCGLVLLMDDDDIIRKSCSGILSGMGYQVVQTVDGEEAVKAYGEYLQKGIRFQGVILDMTVVQGMGGMQAGTKILQMDPSANLIVSSGYSEDLALSDPCKFGFKAALPKPYRISDLIKAMAKAEA